MDMRDIALGIAHVCVRNTVIEQYHAAGKLTDEEMKAFNKEVANKLYTTLTLSCDRETLDAACALFVEYRPPNWDLPTIDRGIYKAVTRKGRERDAS
jgi:hypothetical protein